MLDEVDYYALGERIRRARQQRCMTQEQLGAACSLSTSFIGHIERGSRTLSVETLFRIARTLNVSFDYLLMDSLEPEDSPEINIAAMLKGKDPNKIQHFWAAVRALADKIDEL